MSVPLEHKKVTIDNVTWTPVTTPFPCNVLTIQQTDAVNGVKFRTDSADANTEITFPAGSAYTVDAPRSFKDPLHPGGYRFNGTVLYAQAVAGTGPLLAMFCV